MEGEGRAWGSCAGAHRGVLSFGHFFGREGLLDESLWSRDPHLLEKRGDLRTARLVYMKQGLRLSEDFTAWDAPFTLSRQLDMVSMLGNDLCCEGVTGVVARRNLHEVERPPRCLDAQSVAWPRIGGHVE